MNRTRSALFALLSSAALSLAACSHNIGDSCQTSADCDPNGVWSCDLSQPGGYCTLVGCDPVTAICPGGSSCIRLFPLSLLPDSADVEDIGMACDPTATTSACPPDLVCSSKDQCEARMCDPTAATNTCPPGLICSSNGTCAHCDSACEDVSCPGRAPENQCLADELCLDVGLCAKQSLEERQCAKDCSSNGDCRGGYECRVAGTDGTMVLSSNQNATASFCAPDIAPAP